MKAVKKFKSKLWKRRPELASGIWGREGQIVQPPLQLGGQDSRALRRSQSVDVDNRRPIENATVSDSVHHEIEGRNSKGPMPLSNKMDSTARNDPEQSHAQGKPHQRGLHSPDAAPQEAGTHIARTPSGGEKGHAHNPMDEEPLWLGIGTGSGDAVPEPETPMCAESPTAAEFNIYDTAYRLEVERIRQAKGSQATVYLTRRVDSKAEYREDTNMIDAPTAAEVMGQAHAGWKSLLDAAREKEQIPTKHVDGWEADGQNLHDPAT